MLGETVRKIGFWTLDSIRGGKVRDRMNQLNAIREARQGNPEALVSLLNHAISTVPAYKDIQEPELSAFPVVSKADYRKQFERFRSKHYLDDSQLHKVHTSGSTGTPFMAYQDRDKILWHRAGLLGLNEQLGWHLGDRFLFMRMWQGSHENGGLSMFISNTVPAEVCNFHGQKVEQVRRRLLQDKHLQLILGYASAVEILARYVLEAGDTPEELGIRMVVTDSECLSENARAVIRRAFGCPVLDRYGNNENGILGITLDDSRIMEINFPEYYVELLKLDSDVPVAPGELGRIVITDLYNKAFPFIRYDTGDVGVAAEMLGRQCMKLESLGGRSASILTAADGTRMGESTSTAFFEDVEGIGRWQLAQIGKGQYELRLEDTPKEMDEVLRARCLCCFGADAQVSICHVEKIPQGKNGKYKVTINETDADGGPVRSAQERLADSGKAIVL